MNNESELIQNLFRQEFAKMVAVISNHFGLEHIEIAEDIVSETFLQATETWRIKGMPPNPAAWLYVVAKQKTLYQFRRNKIFTEKVVPQIKKEKEEQDNMTELDFSERNIQDSQLQMMFAICNPAIASEAQIGLALRILCGFSIDEIAEAFLSNKETINKRLFRAKEKLRSEHLNLDFPEENEISNRLDNVLHIIYLLFSEGYYSTTYNQTLRKDFCLEAMRLALMLIDYPKTNTPQANALMSLMCFHASRFEARQSDDNFVILYDEQNEKLWNRDLIARGKYFLDASANGNEISTFHLEAGIAYWHCQKEDSAKKWENILHLYNLLLQINYSPAVAINRIYALYKARGNAVAIPVAEELKFTNNYLYFIVLGELYKDVDNNKASRNYELALALAKKETEQQLINKKLESLNK